MMERDPSKRLTVAEAMAHPWFAPLRATVATTTATIAPTVASTYSEATQSANQAVPRPLGSQVFPNDVVRASLSAGNEAGRLQKPTAALQSQPSSSRLIIEAGLSRLGIHSGGVQSPAPPQPQVVRAPQANAPRLAGVAAGDTSNDVLMQQPVRLSDGEPSTLLSVLARLSNNGAGTGATGGGLNFGGDERSVNTGRDELAVSIQLHEAVQSAAQRGLIAQIAAASLMRDQQPLASPPRVAPMLDGSSTGNNNFFFTGTRGAMVSSSPAASAVPAADVMSGAAPTALTAVPSLGYSSGSVGDASPAGGALGTDWQQLQVLGIVARSLDFARLVTAQAAAAAIFEAAYLAVRNHPSAADVVRKHAVAARELQWGVAQTIGECRVLADAIVNILPDMRE